MLPNSDLYTVIVMLRLLSEIIKPFFKARTYRQKLPNTFAPVFFLKREQKSFSLVGIGATNSFNILLY